MKDRYTNNTCPNLLLACFVSPIHWNVVCVFLFFKNESQPPPHPRQPPVAEKDPRYVKNIKQHSRCNLDNTYCRTRVSPNVSELMLLKRNKVACRGLEYRKTTTGPVRRLNIYQVRRTATGANNLMVFMSRRTCSGLFNIQLNLAANAETS